MDFFTAVENEASHNRSLIENAYSKYLKSNLAGDYNASTGKYIAKDGASWVSASKNCVAYFMDPRNFLDENHIYMFEQLHMTVHLRHRQVLKQYFRVRLCIKTI